MHALLKSLRASARPYSTFGTKVTHKRQNYVTLFVASSTVLGVSLYVLNKKPIYNDSAIVETGDKVNVNAPLDRQNGLSAIVWGSNYNRLIDPDRSSTTCFKTPTYTPNLFSSPLRDLAFSVDHAACVDASGDVYQWGDGFFGAGSVESRRPQLTLRGKNITSIATTPKKIFALSDSGRVFALPSTRDQQSNTSLPNSWWSFFSSSDSQPYFSELVTDVPLHRSERISSISAGTDHLLALTTRGRVFAHPVTRHANLRGQLGVRQITVQDPTNAFTRIPVELNPVTPDDERRIRTVVQDVSRLNQSGTIAPEDPINDKRVGYCDRLFEIPTLRGIDIAQIATGDRTSFAVTRQHGRVLGWGANEFGQLGFGGNVTVPVVSVPTEVFLSKFTKRGTVSRCVDIAAGGDLTYFVVERDIASTGETKIFDVLASGNGQWGGLGNGTYSNCQGEPVKVKNLSGLMEYDESNNSLAALRPYRISVAPGPVSTDTGSAATTSGHAIAMLDTLPHSHPFSGNERANEIAYPPGRDVITWGLNQHFQLGNGKRSSSNMPLSVRTSDGEGRLMCQIGQEPVKDLRGRIVKRKGRIEQRVLAGPGFSVVFWKVL